jgi:zona occludens toxin (predicted ATPase)
MGKRAVERKLRKSSDRLRELRSELLVIDEQLAHLAEDADDKRLRAMVADNPAAVIEDREARGHSEAMADHRRHVLDKIAALESSQDDLLDELRLL